FAGVEGGLLRGGVRTSEGGMKPAGRADSSTDIEAAEAAHPGDAPDTPGAAPSGPPRKRCATHASPLAVRSA
ncbi:hypothetical protein, partial [Cupriavidus respiraculi]|uniref:hypothetical protein n=1 Tax=Cupriavidus respiraculi TaxID=195930 RepID=UPI0039F14A14